MPLYPLAESIRLPYPPYLWTVIRRTAGIWLLLRLVIGMMFLGVVPFPDGIAMALHPSLLTRAAIASLAAVLVWWDRRRSHELLLSANLGTRPIWFWTASLITALVLELVTYALIAAL